MRRILLGVGSILVGLSGACGDDPAETKETDQPSGASCEGLCASLEDVAGCGGDEGVPICTSDCNAASATCSARAPELLACLTKLSIECLSPGTMIARGTGASAETPAVVPIEHGSITIEDAECAEIADRFLTCKPGTGGVCESIATLVDDFESRMPNGPPPAEWDEFCDTAGIAGTADTLALVCAANTPTPGGQSAYNQGLRRYFMPPLDASTYHGLRLRVLVQDAPTTLRFSFGVPATALPPEGTCGVGVCDPMLPCEGCSDHFGVERALEVGANDVVIPFSEVVQEGYGDPATFDPANIVYLTIQGPLGETFVFGIEELGLCN